jgi:transposase-like protein
MNRDEKIDKIICELTGFSTQMFLPQVMRFLLHYLNVFREAYNNSTGEEKFKYYTIIQMIRINATLNPKRVLFRTPNSPLPQPKLNSRGRLGYNRYGRYVTDKNNIIDHNIELSKYLNKIFPRDKELTFVEKLEKSLPEVKDDFLCLLRQALLKRSKVRITNGYVEFRNRLVEGVGEIYKQRPSEDECQQRIKELLHRCFSDKQILGKPEGSEIIQNYKSVLVLESDNTYNKILNDIIRYQFYPRIKEKKILSKDELRGFHLFWTIGIMFNQIPALSELFRGFLVWKEEIPELIKRILQKKATKEERLRLRRAQIKYLKLQPTISELTSNDDSIRKAEERENKKIPYSLEDEIEDKEGEMEPLRNLIRGNEKDIRDSIEEKERLNRIKKVCKPIDYEIVMMLNKGYKVKEIAKELRISEQAVYKRITRIKQKLNKSKKFF